MTSLSFGPNPSLVSLSPPSPPPYCTAWDRSQTWYFGPMNSTGPGTDFSKLIIMSGLNFRFNDDGSTTIWDLYGLNFTNNVFDRPSSTNSGGGWPTAGWGNNDEATVKDFPQPPNTTSPNPKQTFGVTRLDVYPQSSTGSCKSVAIGVTWANIYNPRESYLDIGGNVTQNSPYTLSAPLGTFIYSLEGTYAPSGGGGNGFGAFIGGKAVGLRFAGTPPSNKIYKFIDQVQQCEDLSPIWTMTCQSNSYDVQLVRSNPSIGPVTGIYSDYSDGKGPNGLFWFDVTAINDGTILGQIYGNICAFNLNTSGDSTQGIRPVFQNGFGTFYIKPDPDGVSYDFGVCKIALKSGCAPAGCKSDNDCKQNPVNKVCNVQNGQCVLCTPPSHGCLNGQVCINNNQCQTQSACSSDHDCPSVLPHCNLNVTPHLCVQCMLNTDCSANQFCNANNQCQTKGTCQNTRDCPNGYICVANQCVPQPPTPGGSSSHTTLYIIIGVVGFVIAIAVMVFIAKRRK